MKKEEEKKGKCRGLVLMSGGLDSQLAVRVLQRAGAFVEAVCFVTPFFDNDKARHAAESLGVTLHEIDFLDDEIALIKNPPHGFGGAVNPCIDCHARMIQRAGELMQELGYDFVATGEVVGQRPMSQNKQSIALVEKCSGLKGRLVRPLSALLLVPTEPETKGLLDRTKLLDLSGRGRERQIALAAEFGITDYPSPAGGCKLTEEGFGRKMRDLMANEGLDNRALVELLLVGRRFRLPDGTGVILGRDKDENVVLRGKGEVGTVIAPCNVPGPTALVPHVASTEDFERVKALVAAYSRSDRLNGDVCLRIVGRDYLEPLFVEVPRPYKRAPFVKCQIC